jgi:hypothetical protein
MAKRQHWQQRNGLMPTLRTLMSVVRQIACLLSIAVRTFG